MLKGTKTCIKIPTAGRGEVSGAAKTDGGVFFLGVSSNVEELVAAAKQMLFTPAPLVLDFRRASLFELSSGLRRLKLRIYGAVLELSIFGSLLSRGRYSQMT